MNDVYSRFRTAYENAYTSEVVSLPVMNGGQEMLFVYRAIRLSDGGLVDDVSHIYKRDIQTGLVSEIVLANLVDETISKKVLSTPFSTKIAGDSAAKLIEEYHTHYDEALSQPQPTFPSACQEYLEELFDGGLLLLYGSLLKAKIPES